MNYVLVLEVTLLLVSVPPKEIQGSESQVWFSFQTYLPEVISEIPHIP
jgi:hypothetical protein